MPRSAVCGASTNAAHPRCRLGYDPSVLALALTLSLGAPFAQPTRIHEVRVEGRWLTTDSTVRRELTFAPGALVTPEAWDLFLARLWNLRIFSRVELTLEREGEGEGERNTAVVRLEDALPIFPILYLQFGGNQFFLWAGASHVNVLGRALEVFGYYQRFGPLNGFHVHVMDPRLLNTRTLGQLDAEWLARPRPEFLHRRAAVRLRLEASPPESSDDRVRIGLRVEGTSDELASRGEPSAVPPPSRGALLAPYVRFGRLDTDRLRFSKGFLEVRAGVGVTDDPSSRVWNQLEVEGQWFIKLGRLFNVASRLKAGLSHDARPQDRFYVGGLDLVRGYQDSEVRAVRYVSVNAELRLVAFDSTWFAIMPVAFLDAGLARRDTGATASLSSVGMGLRLLIPRIPMYGARVELALPLVPGVSSPALQPGVNFGIWHFF